MKNVYIFLLVLLCASCSRLVNAEYDVLDKGTVTDVIQDPPDFVKINIISAKDSIYRQWRHFSLQDDLSLKGVVFAEQIKTGDFVYIYHGNEGILISKTSIEDAKTINQVVSQQFWDNEFALWLVGIMFVATILFWVFAYKDKWLYLIVSQFVVLIFVLWHVNLNEKLEFVGNGVISYVNNYEGSSSVTLNNSDAYIVNTMSDVINEDKQLKKGDRVFVYAYAGNHIISTTELNQHTLKQPQCYPEKFLWVMATYLGLVLMVMVFSFCIILDQERGRA